MAIANRGIKFFFVVISIQVDGFMKTDMWPRMLKLLKFVSNESDWHPYDVALNFVRCADHTRIHPDAETHQVNVKRVCILLTCLV